MSICDAEENEHHACQHESGQEHEEPEGSGCYDECITKFVCQQPPMGVVPVDAALEQDMSAYDLDLMRQSFRLLGQALEGGQLTWHEYFVELEAFVRRGQSYLKLESRYQKLLADIYADSL